MPSVDLAAEEADSDAVLRADVAAAGVHGGAAGHEGGVAVGVGVVASVLHSGAVCVGIGHVSQPPSNSSGWNIPVPIGQVIDHNLNIFCVPVPVSKIKFTKFSLQCLNSIYSIF